MKKGLIGAIVLAIIAAAGWYWIQGQITKDPVSAAAPGSSPDISGAQLADVVVPAELSAQAKQGET
jgi:hypothetical protein